MIKYILKKHSKHVILIALLSIICAYLTLLLPDIFADIISNGIGNSDTTFIHKSGIALIIISLFILISSILTSFFSNKLGALLGFELRQKLYEKTLNLDEYDIKNYGISSLIVRNTNDINQIQNMVSIFFKTIAFTLSLGLGSIIKVSSKALNIPSLTLIIIISILVVAIILFIIFITVIPKYNKLQKILDKINKRTREVLQGILVIKVFNQEKFEQNKSQSFNKDYINLEYFLNKIMSLLNPFVTLILNMCTIAIVIIIFKEATTLTELANMLAFSEYATQVISAFLSLAICFILLPKAFVSYNRITEVINTYTTIYDQPNAKELKEINCIEFKKVSFAYPNSEENIISNMSFKINKGETIAIIGPTGSGKSTITSLINRFYDVSNGAILINNIDIRNIKLDCLNQKIATVFQNDFMMRSKIKEMLLENNADKIYKALNAACISELANDLNKEINFDGSNLSGGQKQRLRIARALLKKSDLLILDDALSGVDYKTEKTIINNLKNQYPDLIKIIITSRISLLKNVDKIMVINDGKLTGYDTHQVLIRNNPTYKQIINITNQKEDKNA